MVVLLLVCGKRVASMSLSGFHFVSSSLSLPPSIIFVTGGLSLSTVLFQPEVKSPSHGGGSYAAVLVYLSFLESAYLYTHTLAPRTMSFAHACGSSGK